MKIRFIFALVLLHLFAAGVWGQKALRLIAPSEPVAQGNTFQVRVANAPPGAVAAWQWDGARLKMVSATDLSITLRAAKEGRGYVTATVGSWTKMVQIAVQGTGTKPLKPKEQKKPQKPEGGDEGKLTARDKAALNLLDEYRNKLGDLADTFGQGQDGRADLTGARQRALAAQSEGFFRSLGKLGFSVNPGLIGLKSKLKKLYSQAGESPLQGGDRFWNESYLAVERALMTGRVLLVQDLWNQTLKEYINGDPENRIGVVYGEIDIGSWVKMEKAGMTFEGDIDFSSVATACEANREVRALFEGKLRGAVDQSMSALDAFLTAHGDATKEVFVGEWGKTFAEFDFLKRGKWKLIKTVQGGSGAVEGIEFVEKRAELLFWERAFRTGQPFDPPKVTLETEPMLSMEMLRHIIGDVERGPFSRGDKIKKLLKYAERSYFYNRKAGSELGWNPYDSNDPVLAKVADAVIRNKDNPAAIAEELQKLTGGDLTGANVDTVIDGLLERAKKAVTMNAERGLSLRLQKIAREADEKKRKEQLDKLWEQMRKEIKVYNDDGRTPPEHLERALDLAEELRRGETSPEYVKNVEKLRNLLTDVFALPGSVLDRLFTSDAAMKLRRHFKEKLQWKDDTVEKCIRQLKEKHPDLGKVYDTVVEFNEKVGRSAAGSRFLRAADFADNAFALYDAYYGAKDRNTAFWAVSEQMARIGLQEKWPWTALPLGVYDSLRTGDPKYLGMAVAFYYFPFAGQIYMVSQQCQRLDVALDDSGFAGAMNEMYARTRFDESGRISALLFYKQNIIKAGREPDLICDVEPAGDRSAIMKIARSNDFGPSFETEPGFTYWASLVPSMEKGDYYSYAKKLQNLRRFFAYSEDVNYLCVMLENLRNKVDELDADQRNAMIQMEDQLQQAIWMAMADALESAKRTARPGMRTEWEARLEELEGALAFRKHRLVDKASFEVEKRKSLLRGEDVYSTGLIYDRYIRTYTTITGIRQEIWDAWYHFDLDVRKAFNAPCKSFIGGVEGRYAPVLTAEPEKDLAAAQKCLKNQLALAQRAKADLASALGRTLDERKDRRHLQIVGQLLFEWGLLREDSPETNGEAMRTRSIRYREYLENLKALRDMKFSISIKGPSKATVGDKVVLEAVVEKRGDAGVTPILLWSDEKKRRIGKGPTVAFAAAEEGSHDLKVQAFVDVSGEEEKVAEAAHTLDVKAPSETKPDAKGTSGKPGVKAAEKSSKGAADAPPLCGPKFLCATIPDGWVDISDPADSDFILKREIRWQNSRAPRGSTTLNAEVSAKLVDTDVSYDSPPHYAALRKVVEGKASAGWKQDLTPFAVGDFNGFIIETPGLVKEGYGYTEKGDPGCWVTSPRMQALGTSFVVKGRDLIHIEFHMSGRAEVRRGPDADPAEVQASYDDHLGFINPTSEKLHSQIKSIIGSIYLGPAKNMERAAPKPEPEEKTQVLLTREPSGGDAAPLGAPVTFRAKVVSPEGKDAPGAFVYRWQPSSEVAFSPPEGSDDVAAATFIRPGKVKVWVEVLRTKGADLEKVGESEPMDLDVCAPKLTVTLDPAEPLVGQEVTATAAAEPDSEEIDFRWEVSENVEILEESQDSRALRFVLKDDVRAEVAARGRVKYYGDELGEAAASATAKPYDVTVSGPRAIGPRARVWKEGQGLVEVVDGFAEYQDLALGAEMSSELSEPDLRYSWKVTPGGATLSSDSTRTVRVSCSSVGTYEAKVTVKDVRGLELGSATASITITVSKSEVRKSEEKRKEGREKAKEMMAQAEGLRREGKNPEALDLYDKAVRLDPDSPQLYLYRARTKAILKDIRGFEEDLAKSLELDPDYTHAYNTRGIYRESQGNLSGALEDYERAIRMDPNSVPAHYNKGLLLQRYQDPEGAIEEYTKAIDLADTPEGAKTIADRNLALYNAHYRRGECRALRNDVKGAYADYMEAVRFRPELKEARRNAEDLRKRHPDLAR